MKLLCSLVTPIVLWHGMGDSWDSAHMRWVQENIRQVYQENNLPTPFIWSIRLSQEDDKRDSYFGDVNEQVQRICEQLSEVVELQCGFDGIGFSQVKHLN